MDIQEQIDQFLQIPEIKEIFSDHDIHWHVGEYSQGWYFDFSVPDYEKGFFLGAWNAWQAVKAQAVLEKDAIIKKLSDQLYSQEMKTSAARTLCETACELLDDYAHQDAMVILNDLEQAMLEAQEQKG